MPTIIIQALVRVTRSIKIPVRSDSERKFYNGEFRSGTEVAYVTNIILSSFAQIKDLAGKFLPGVTITWDQTDDNICGEYFSGGETYFFSASATQCYSLDEVMGLGKLEFRVEG